MKGVFSPSYRMTIGVDFALKTLKLNSNIGIRLQLWDIAGQERFGHMTRVIIWNLFGNHLLTCLGLIGVLQRSCRGFYCLRCHSRENLPRSYKMESWHYPEFRHWIWFYSHCANCKQSNIILTQHVSIFLMLISLTSVICLEISLWIKNSSTTSVKNMDSLAGKIDRFDFT